MDRIEIHIYMNIWIGIYIYIYIYTVYIYIPVGETQYQAKWVFCTALLPNINTVRIALCRDLLWI